MKCRIFFIIPFSHENSDLKFGTRFKEKKYYEY